MANAHLPDLCLGFPIDHRLESLFKTGLAAADPSGERGSHARIIESYGHHLQEDREDISEDEVQFAKWLAKPRTTGGVVIALLQPAEHQRYFSNHQQTVDDCDTLAAIDEVCRTITGSGLEEISCFDAFPFHKRPVSKSLDEYEKDLDKAYDIFLDMIEEKQPDVVFCCYRSPHSTKYKHFQCIGIGRTRDYRVTVRGKKYTCVNGFHPSFALNFLEDKSALRTLFILEAAQAFHQANGSWRESDWMADVRENCEGIAQIKREGKKLFSTNFSHHLWRVNADSAPYGR
jgi:hypothetical protein